MFGIQFQKKRLILSLREISIEGLNDHGHYGLTKKTQPNDNRTEAYGNRHLNRKKYDQLGTDQSMNCFQPTNTK